MRIIITFITYYLHKAGQRMKKEDGFWDYIIGIAFGLVLAAFIFMPQMKTFASGVMTAMTTWWTSVKTAIFSTNRT